MHKLLPILPKPSRYIGIEEGSVHKNPASVSLRIALAFPDMYEVGMSYLGQKILYDILNKQPNWWAERVFTPCEEAGKILQEHKTPLCSLESGTSLAKFDAIGFSITHELCYTNVLYMLDLAGLPLYSAQRKDASKQWPLIIAGGGCTLAAEPLAPFVDVMILGEGEECLPEVLEQLEQCKAKQQSRQEVLLALSHIPGVYVPEFFTANTDRQTPESPYLTPLYEHHQTVVRRILPDLDKAHYPDNQPIPFGAVHNRLALEIARGCTRGCRFCQAGSVYRPVRERKVETLQNLLQSCLSSTGFDDVSFLSLSTGDFSALKELFMNTVERCAFEQVSVSLPSLRVGSIDNDIMERMADIRRTGATLAPEAGSQRLRDVINKGITEEDLILHIQKLFEHGWQQVKLYFMIGLPTETDEDILAILDLCKKARDAAGPGIKRLQITAALSPFVPKPHTPFQWEPQISREEMRRRVGLLLNAIKGEKRIKMRWHEPEMSFLEGVFSRGDRKLAKVIETAYRKGAIFTSWIDKFALQPWLESMTEHGLSPEDYTRGRSLEEALPWDHLNCGLSREFFLRELQNAHKGKTVEDCRYFTCLACGACDTKAGSSLLHPMVPNALSPEKQNNNFKNMLNNPQRDQEAHKAALDEYGRVIVKAAPDGGKPAGKNQPPVLAAHLIAKKSNLRFWYARTGKAVYISQLELQNIFDRAMRRASLPISFSQGFHPLPLVSFGRALPVGVASECEWFSVYLSAPQDIDSILKLMNKGLPEGLAITSAEELPLQNKSNDADTETYILRINDPELSNNTFTDVWQKIETSSSIPWSREGKRGMRQLEARSFIKNIAMHDRQSCQLTFDWSTAYVSPLALVLFLMENFGLKLTTDQILLTKKSQAWSKK